jgi:hypothetical protein
VEFTLHRQLKEPFGPAAGGRLEVVVDGFRIDAVAGDGALIEVQSGSLGPLRSKLSRLLPRYRVRVVKPVILSRRLIRRADRDGSDLSARLSPKRGELSDVFEDLVGVAPLLSHPNLRVDLLSLAIDEIRLPRRGRPGFTVLDRRLRTVLGTVALERARDLWDLLPPGLDDPFTTRDLARLLGGNLHNAQRVAYCLRESGAAEGVGKQGNHRVYRRMSV